MMSTNINWDINCVTLTVFSSYYIIFQRGGRKFDFNISFNVEAINISTNSIESSSLISWYDSLYQLVGGGNQHYQYHRNSIHGEQNY